MDEQIKKLASEIKQTVLEAKKILMHLHPSPDEDSVGSVIALAQVLKKWEKDYTIISGDSHVPPWAKYLPGGDEIIDQRYLDTKAEEYDLHIALDTGGRRQITRRGEFVFPEGQKVILIDHHVTSDNFGNINLVVDNYPATAQILYDLCLEWGVEIDHDIATNLFIGIYGDTGGFQYPKTTEYTFRIAADLVAKAPDFAKTISNLRNNDEKERIVFQSLALSLIEEYVGGRVLIAPIDRVTMESHKIKQEHTENNQISNTLRGIKGCDIGVSMIEDAEGTRVSFRSKDSAKYDVSQIAAALGGGGHKGAAACHLNTFLPDSKKMVLDKIKEFYPEFL